MFNLILATVLLVSGSVLLILAVRRFEDLRINFGLGLTCLLFLGQGTSLLSQLGGRVKQQVPATAKAAPTGTPAPVSWDQGGTLQAASLDTWRQGSYDNRLASAADLLKDLRRQQLFAASIRSQQDYRPWAAALVACLEASPADLAEPVRQLAQACVADDGLRRYLR